MWSGEVCGGGEVCGVVKCVEVVVCGGGEVCV